MTLAEIIKKIKQPNSPETFRPSAIIAAKVAIDKAQRTKTEEATRDMHKIASKLSEKEVFHLGMIGY